MLSTIFCNYFYYLSFFWTGGQEKYKKEDIRKEKYKNINRPENRPVPVHPVHELLPQKEFKMPKCNQCGAEIFFQKHPQSNALTPFSKTETGAVIHFQVCGKKHEDKMTVKYSLKQMGCTKGHDLKYIFWQKITSGVRIGTKCEFGHKGPWLAHTEANIKAINCTHEESCKELIDNGHDSWGNLVFTWKELRDERLRNESYALSQGKPKT